MKKMYKAMALVLCAVLLVAGSVMGTLAYLQSQTKSITNVMTVGNVQITLSESKVNEYGAAQGDDKIISTATGVTGEQNTYKLIPGHTYTKDPKITVTAKSEACYVFVKVVNGIKEIEDASNTIEKQITTTYGWTELDGVANVYYKSVGALENDEDYEVFKNFTVKSDLNHDALDDYKDATIEITAYAVQQDGFNSAKDAWVAAQFS